MQKTQIAILVTFTATLFFFGLGCNSFNKDTQFTESETIVTEERSDSIDYGDQQMAEDTAFSNPATIYCLSQEGQFYMKKTMSGATEGYCILPSGLECEIWAMYKGDCGKVKKPEIDNSTLSTTTELETEKNTNLTTSTALDALKSPTTSTTNILENEEFKQEPEISNNGKKKIKGDIDIAVRPGNENGEIIMTWDTHELSAPEGYIIMLGTNSNLSYPTKFSYILENENSYSFTWTDLNPDREYYFRVCIKQGENCSIYSPVISIAP